MGWWGGGVDAKPGQRGGETLFEGVKLQSSVVMEKSTVASGTNHQYILDVGPVIVIQGCILILF